MLRRGQAAEPAQSPWGELDDPGHDLGPESGEADPLLNDQEPASPLDRLDNRPDVERIKLRRTENLAGDLMQVEERVKRLLDVGKHTAVAEDRQIGCALGADPGRRKQLIGLLERKAVGDYSTDSEPVEELVLDDDGRPVDCG